MRKIKTRELTGEALNWACALALGDKPVLVPLAPGSDESHAVGRDWRPGDIFDPCNNWDIGGPIMEEREVGYMSTGLDDPTEKWEGRRWNDELGTFDITFGPTPLVAGMRCLCLSHLGKEVEIPPELAPCP